MTMSKSTDVCARCGHLRGEHWDHNYVRTWCRHIRVVGNLLGRACPCKCFVYEGDQ